jgi:hypothetical protein
VTRDRDDHRDVAREVRFMAVEVMAAARSTPAVLISRALS